MLIGGGIIPWRICGTVNVGGGIVTVLAVAMGVMDEFSDDVNDDVDEHGVIGFNSNNGATGPTGAIGVGIFEILEIFDRFGATTEVIVVVFHNLEGSGGSMYGIC